MLPAEQLAAIKESIAVLDGKLDRTIIHLEGYGRTVDAFDDRTAVLQKTAEDLTAVSRNLANTVIQLRSERRLSVFMAVAVAGVIGGVIASVAHDAFAHWPDSALHSGEAK